MVPPVTATLSAPPPRRKPFRRVAAPKKLRHERTISLEAFLDWDQEERDGWKYEWVRGVVQTYERSMKPEEKYLLGRLNRAFYTTAASRAGGELLTETVFVLPGNDRVRHPDLAYYTKEQIARCTKERSPVPAFIIEIISQHDNALELERKLDDYFNDGVQCVWLMMPQMGFIKTLTTPAPQRHLPARRPVLRRARRFASITQRDCENRITPTSAATPTPRSASHR